MGHTCFTNIGKNFVTKYDRKEIILIMGIPQFVGKNVLLAINNNWFSHGGLQFVLIWHAIYSRTGDKLAAIMHSQTICERKKKSSLELQKYEACESDEYELYLFL